MCLCRSLTTCALELVCLYPGVCNSLQVFLCSAGLLALSLANFLQMLLHLTFKRKSIVELSLLYSSSASKPHQKSPPAKSCHSSSSPLRPLTDSAIIPFFRTHSSFLIQSKYQTSWSGPAFEVQPLIQSRPFSFYQRISPPPYL